MKRFLCLLLAPLTVVASLAVTAFKNPPLPKATPESFRVTTYLVCGGKTSPADFRLCKEDFAIITDVILFGAVTFDENGNLLVDEPALAAAKEAVRTVAQDTVKIHLNLLGPDSESTSEDWYEQMADKAQRHTNAFRSAEMIPNICALLEKQELDGVFFDYEYPIKQKAWSPFNRFLIGLKKQLPADVVLGIALADWDIKLSRGAMQAVDRIEMMLYDNFDAEGRHSPVVDCNALSEKFVKFGFDKAKLDYGVPFYARPSDKDSYWYDYASYFDKLSADGSYVDTSLNKTFWFNTPKMIAEKTAYALDSGFGGMMIWHYACDLPSVREESVLRAMGKEIASRCQAPQQ